MLKSAADELRWPAVVAPALAPVYVAFSQLEASQWFKPQRLRQLQSLQLSARLQHARKCSRHFAPLLADKDLRPVQAFEVLAGLPILRRADLQAEAQALFCMTGSVHGETGETRTSGSSGEPVVVRYTGAAQVLRNALSLRALGWHALDVRKSFAVVRASITQPTPDEPVRFPHWNAHVAGLFGSGPAFGLSVRTPVDRQLAILQRERPAYFLSYPSNLRGLMELSPANPCGLEVVICVGETLAPELRQALTREWGVKVRDEYSAEETGPIASQCEHGLYHTMAEGLHVEIVREDGTACTEGETGRVVLTDLHNFGTALLRYDIRDYAEVGPACACGRGLPTLTRILGRERNLIRLPDGRRFWPMFGFRDERAASLLRQFQVLQTSLTQLTLRLWPRNPLGEAERTMLTELVQGRLGYPLAIAFEEFDGPLPTGPNGKFQEFVCLLDA